MSVSQTTETPPDDDGRRRNVFARVRAAIDFLEQHPEIPLPPNFDRSEYHTFSRSEFVELARKFGAQLLGATRDGRVQAVASLGGYRIDITVRSHHVVDEPFGVPPEALADVAAEIDGAPPLAEARS